MAMMARGVRDGNDADAFCREDPGVVGMLLGKVRLPTEALLNVDCTSFRYALRSTTASLSAAYLQAC